MLLVVRFRLSLRAMSQARNGFSLPKGLAAASSRPSEALAVACLSVRGFGIDNRRDGRNGWSRVGIKRRLEGEKEWADG